MLVFDQLQNSFLTYDESGAFLKVKNVGDEITENLSIVVDQIQAFRFLWKY